MRYILTLASDLHVNSTLGLLPERMMLDDGGEYVALRKAQGWVRERWLELLATAKELRRPGDWAGGVIVGDGPDRNPKSTQLVTLNESDIINAFAEVAGEMHAVCPDGFWIVRGTEAHVGNSGWMEEVVARMVNATRYPTNSPNASCWKLRLELGGVRIHLTHHGPLGRLPNTKLNPLGNVAAKEIDEALRDGIWPPNVLVQAHNHTYADTFDNYVVRIIALPSFQLQTSFVHRIGATKQDIGGVVLVIEEGRVDALPVMRRPAAEAAWSPETVGTVGATATEQGGKGAEEQGGRGAEESSASKTLLRRFWPRR